MKLKNFAMITEDKVFRKLKETPENFANYKIFNELYFIELTII